MNESTRLDISTISHNSKEIIKNGTFFAIKGFKTDGHEHVFEASANGHRLFVVEHCIPDLKERQIVVDSVKDYIVNEYSNLFGNFSSSLQLIGITGTNGKTTTAHMLYSTLLAYGKIGLVGTVVNKYGNINMGSNNTTPPLIELTRFLERFSYNGVSTCIVETSSHGLALGRVHGLEYAHSIITNLSQEHLDFHGTLDKYISAKLKILSITKGYAFINIDCPNHFLFMKNASKPVTYSVSGKADYIAKNIVNYSDRVCYDFVSDGINRRVVVNATGENNVYNSLSVLAFNHKVYGNIDNAIEALELFRPVPGRFEMITDYGEVGVCIDYAHSPNGLLNLLNQARIKCSGRVILVFGCGGDRDRVKRPVMGNIAVNKSDYVIVTSDNPRTEKPMSIISDIVAGMDKDNFEIEEDRKRAIYKALKIAHKGDLVILAGKGHERYQIVGKKRFPFNELSVLKDTIRRIRIENIYS